MTTHSKRRRRGSQAIEFALVLPVLVSLTAGIVDYGWYFSQHLSMLDAIRSGARTGVATSTNSPHTPCQVSEAAALSALQVGGFPSATNAHVTTQLAFDGPDADGDGVNDSVLYVAVDVPFQTLWGLVRTPAKVRGMIAMRVEHQKQARCGPL